MPPAYRGATEATAPAGPASLADLPWFDLFNDTTLTRLVNTALAQNFDLQIAARARAAGARARSYRPCGSVSGGRRIGGARTNARVGGWRAAVAERIRSGGLRYSGGFGVAWELDVWGRLRRANEGARAQYLATEEARRGVVTTLVADVTEAYFALQTFDRQLAIAERTREVAVDGLRLTELRRDRGVATGLDVRQAQQLLYTATGQNRQPATPDRADRRCAESPARTDAGRRVSQHRSGGASRRAAAGAARAALVSP